MPSCVVHADQDAVAYCRNCGRAMCAECKRDVRGMIYCEDCLAGQVPAPAAAAGSGAAAGATPGYDWAQRPLEGPSPALAMFLGLIPGVGAIYNGQYAKAFLHVVVLGLLMTLASSAGRAEPIFVLLTICFWAYMAGEAYHTAKRRLMGIPVDEWSGLLAPGSRLQGAAGAVVLIVIGVVFLLDTLNLVPLHQIIRYWPVALIVAGALMLYRRVTPPGSRGGDAL